MGFNNPDKFIKDHFSFYPKNLQSKLGIDSLRWKSKLERLIDPDKYLKTSVNFLIQILMNYGLNGKTLNWHMEMKIHLQTTQGLNGQLHLNTRQQFLRINNYYNESTKLL